MNWFTRWRAARALGIVQTLARIEQRLQDMTRTLDDIKANEDKLRVKVEKLLALVQNAQPGAFTADQQAEIDAIASDQDAVLAEGESAPAPTT
jgi:hypothetical protein